MYVEIVRYRSLRERFELSLSEERARGRPLSSFEFERSYVDVCFTPMFSPISTIADEGLRSYGTIIERELFHHSRRHSSLWS